MKPAFLIIDMQHDLSHIWTKDIVDAQLELLEYCRKTEADTFLIELPSEGPTESGILNFWNSLRKKHRILKRNVSAFDDTELNDELISIKADYLVVMGVNSECCVYRTIDDALNLGYGVGISKDTTNKISDLNWYERNTGLFETSRELIAYLESQK